MELKTKFQYTYFIHPYVIDEAKYEKYILKLLKNPKCSYKIFEKEKDYDIYNFFLPHVRKFMFPTFELRDERLKRFMDMKPEKQCRIIALDDVSHFTYELEEDISGKVETDEGISFKVEGIDIITFNTGICFFTMKTHLENTNNFSDLLDFNYSFKSINSEFRTLKNYEKIKLTTNAFDNIEDIPELIKEITSEYKTNYEKDNDIANQDFYTFSYVCLESNHWNEKASFDDIENEFLKFANVLPKDYKSDFNKENLSHNLHIIEKLKYVKTTVTNTSSNMICSGMDTYNYSKLPYDYENQFFYTYLLQLYKVTFLRRLSIEFKEYSRIVKLREKFIKFTRQIWNKEITLDDTGSLYYKTLNKALDLTDVYEEIQNKYEVIYKDLNIEKNNNYYGIIVILLIYSMIFNTINILFLMYLLG